MRTTLFFAVGLWCHVVKIRLLGATIQRHLLSRDFKWNELTPVEHISKHFSSYSQQTIS